MTSFKPYILFTFKTKVWLNRNTELFFFKNKKQFLNILDDYSTFCLKVLKEYSSSGASALDLWSGNRDCIFRPVLSCSGSQLERLYLRNVSQCLRHFLIATRARRCLLMWVGRAVD